MKQFHHFLAFSSCLFKSSALASGHINPRTILGGALTARGSTRETTIKGRYMYAHVYVTCYRF